jgi:hypothetical protein
VSPKVAGSPNRSSTSTRASFMMVPKGRYSKMTGKIQNDIPTETKGLRDSDQYSIPRLAQAKHMIKKEKHRISVSSNSLIPTAT